MNALADRFRFNEQLLAVATEGFAADDWSRAPSEQGGNTAHWILGHVALARRGLLRKLGVEVPVEAWEDHFQRGGTPDAAAAYPAPAELIADLAANGERLSERLPSLSEVERGAEWGTAFPDGSTTVAGGAHFLYFHETYHLGQIGLLRRICGKPGFV